MAPEESTPEITRKTVRAALENPDLPLEFIRDILIARMQDHTLAEPFTPSNNKSTHSGDKHAH